MNPTTMTPVVRQVVDDRRADARGRGRARSCACSASRSMASRSDSRGETRTTNAPARVVTCSCVGQATGELGDRARAGAQLGDPVEQPVQVGSGGRSVSGGRRHAADPPSGGVVERAVVAAGRVPDGRDVDHEIAVVGEPYRHVGGEDRPAHGVAVAGTAHGRREVGAGRRQTRRASRRRARRRTSRAAGRPRRRGPCAGPGSASRSGWSGTDGEGEARLVGVRVRSLCPRAR